MGFWGDVMKEAVNGIKETANETKKTMREGHTIVRKEQDRTLREADKEQARTMNEVRREQARLMKEFGISSSLFKAIKKAQGRNIHWRTKMEVWNRAKGICQNPYCKLNLNVNAKLIEFDHIKPFVLHGSNNADNVQLLCRPCNREKGDKYPYKFQK